MISLNLINSNNYCQAYVTVLMVHIYCFYLMETASSKTTIIKLLVGGGAVGGIIYYLFKGRSTCRAN